jgi:hypothetical protein
MSTRVQYREYLANIIEFLNADLSDQKTLIKLVKKTEPKKRVAYDSKRDGFAMGMVVWPVKRVTSALEDIQKSIRETLEFISEYGKVDEKRLNLLNSVCHDLKIRYFYDTTAQSHMKLGYDVPSSRLAWDEGKCPHCGEAVTLQIFPDPIPLFAYDAVINTLRLLSRSVHIKKCKGCGIFFIPEKANQIYHRPGCGKRRQAAM